MNAGPAAKLGEHLATFYWRGVITLDDELLTTYWRNATAAARAHMLEFLGRSAHKANALTADVQDRLMAFWAWARQHTRPGKAAEELAGFVWWFASDGLPAEWRLQQMTELLQAGVRPQAEFLIALIRRVLCRTLFIRLVQRYPGRAAGSGGDRRPTSREVANCSEWLDTELRIVRPRVVLLLGKPAARYFLRAHGQDGRVDWGEVRQIDVGDARATAFVVRLSSPVGQSVGLIPYQLSARSGQPV